MITRLLRRPRPAPPKFTGWTEADGFKKEGAPRNWPFGMQRPVVLPKRVNRKPDEDAPF